jgi:hypothetical protein
MLKTTGVEITFLDGQVLFFNFENKEGVKLCETINELKKKYCPYLSKESK